MIQLGSSVSFLFQFGGSPFPSFLIQFHFFTYLYICKSPKVKTTYKRLYSENCHYFLYPFHSTAPPPSLVSNKLYYFLAYPFFASFCKDKFPTFTKNSILNMLFIHLTLSLEIIPYQFIKTLLIFFCLQLHNQYSITGIYYNVFQVILDIWKISNIMQIL